MSKNVFILLLCMPLWVCAQLQMEPLERDLGDLYGTDKTFIDIKLTNTGSQPVSILTVRTPHNVTYQYSNITIQSDSTEFIRFKIRPEKEGKFNYDFEVFFSHLAEVTVFNVKGNIIEMPSDFMTACPDFSSVGANRNYTAKIEVRVVDRNTGALIPGATVELFYPYGERQITKLPNGKKQLKLEQGYYFAVAGSEGYEMNEKGTYLNAKNNVLQIALDRAPRNEEEGDSVSQDIREISFDEVVFDDSESTTVSEVKDTLLSPEVVDNGPIDFGYDKFAKNNITFVIDVSGSMKNNGKMELLRHSLFELVDNLRDQDQVSLVSYASKATVRLQTTSGANKNAIKDAYNAIPVGGGTSGSKGVILALETNFKSYLAAGVNQVVVVTDGAFRTDDRAYVKALKKYKKRGIEVSVIAIMPRPHGRKILQEMATEGGGFYVELNKIKDGAKLTEAIRKSSMIE